MPKVKIPRKSTLIDMTAMCDVSFLLLTFFMLTTQFKPDEPVVVDTPSSISETKLMDDGVILISMNKDGNIFYSMTGQNTRVAILEDMSARYKVPFNETQIKNFSKMESFGVPIAQLPALLDLKPEDRKSFVQPGIPCDTSKNELVGRVEAAMIAYTAEKDTKPKIAIKGDGKANFPAVKKLIDALQAKNFNTFYFITDLEANPNKKKES